MGSARIHDGAAQRRLKLMRVVVREDFSRSRCDALIKDFKLACETLDAMDKSTVDKHQEYVISVRVRGHLR